MHSPLCSGPFRRFTALSRASLRMDLSNAWTRDMFPRRTTSIIWAARHGWATTRRAASSSRIAAAGHPEPLGLRWVVANGRRVNTALTIQAIAMRTSSQIGLLAKPGELRRLFGGAGARGVRCHDNVQRIIPIVRYGLVVLFFSASALNKIFDFQGAVKQALQVFSSRYHGRPCAVTAVLFKRFWEPGDFWKAGENNGRELFWNFLKNFLLASGS